MKPVEDMRRPFQAQIKSMDTIFGTESKTPIVHSTVFEDNNGALELAKAPRYRPRTKHIAIKYHHFRSHVQNGSIKLEPIDTQFQIADQFTKGLPFQTFKSLRYLLMGW